MIVRRDVIGMPHDEEDEFMRYASLYQIDEYPVCEY